METMIDKLESYNIFNYLLPGAVFDYVFERLIGVNLVSGNIVENLFIFYFLGMILSRVGSIFIEPLCKRIGLIKFVSYGEYIEASRKDELLKVLSEVNNTYRTIFSGGIVLIFSKIYFGIINRFNIKGDVNEIVAIIIIVLVFALSYRKQTQYIANRVKKVNEEVSK